MLNTTPVNTSQNISFGSFKIFSPKRAVPEHLYHISSNENWQKIQSDQKLKPRFSFPDLLKGVFTFDAKNLLQQWTKEKRGQDETAIESLFSAITTNNETSDLVLLRIPVKKLSMDKLSFRKIDDFFKALPQIHNKQVIYEADLKEPNFLKKLEKKLPGKFKTILTGENIKGLSGVISKKPVEIIYKADIPARNIELVGSAQVNKQDSPLDIKKIWREFTKGQPESNLI